MLSDLFRQAMRSVKTNFFRSLLTMLGILISIASIIAVIAIGDGGSQRIASEMELVGTSRIWIYSENDQYMTINDQAILCSSLSDVLEAASPVNQKVVPLQDNAVNGELCGVGEEYFQIEKVDFLAGRPLAAYRQGEAVITQALAAQLFSGDALGQTLSVAGAPFTVCGVLNDARLAASNSNAQRVFIRIEDWLDMFNTDRVTEYILRIRSGSLEDAGNRAAAALADYSGLRKIKSYNMSSQIKMVNEVLDILKTILFCIGLICFLCGGIGIMNVMLISVKEKTREIGLCKALGARDIQILLRFLYESLLYSLLGGALGVPAGALIAYLAAHYAGIPFIFTWKIIVAAAGFSCLAGLVFGIYPALRAVRQKPIEALFYD